MSMLIARAGATWLLDLRAIAVALATVAVLGIPW
jgi:hypothetical protein